MQLRVTLSRGDSFHNVLITADATATDVATAILSEGLSEPLETSGPRPTLQVQDPLGHVAVLSPDAAVAESGVHSGSMIRVVPEPENHAGSETVGAVLRVLDGPDTGLEVPLRIGASRIGRSHSADVRLSDPKVSKLHARVLVGTTIDIIDDNSANGVLVGNQRINRATLGAGDIAVLGKTQLRIDAMAGARGGASVEVAYMRPPRVLSRPVSMELELPDVPEPPTRARFPLLALIGMVRSERVFASVSTEAVDLETAHALARTMSPLVDASSPVEDESDLPRMVSVVGLLGSSVDDPEQVLSRWQDNGSYVNRSAPAVPRERAGDLRAIVGHAGLEPFTIDLRSQGPHALVGGTTGAGKSEFLQAWVLGMAHAHSPDRVTFLFVDYKGGAAFAKCVELPHCVGIVTDLSSYLVRRALRSLRAEIRYREHLFNAKGVKDLIEFEKRGDPECPPSLIIIVDEFAALVGEVPEFIDGVVDVAQRGRSLGLHLVLATQRPAGVIKDNLRANTNLRVALRMNDEHDSTDVLGSPVAASIDPANPGRGVAKMGPGRLIPFQSAFPGARTPAEPPAPPIDVDELDFGMVTRWKIPRASASGDQVEKDIERVVRTVSQASMLGRIPTPRRPWLDTLSESYDLLTLKQQRDSTLMLGVVDDPDNQSQYPDAFHPDETGNIVYYGAGGSGKTTALRSLAIAASITPRSGPVHIYGLDFAGGGLNMLEPLPNVGAIISGDDDERVSRLMEMLTKKLDERAAAFNAVAADVLSKYRQQPGKQDEPRILILLDGFQSFRTEYDSGLQRAKTYSQFHRLLAEGRAVGIHVAVTADRGAAIPSAMQGSFQERIVLRMSDTDQYLTLNVPKDVLNNASPPGRCMNSRNGNEMQLAVLGSDPSPPAQAREIELLAQSIAQFQRTRPEPVRRLPAQVSADELPVTVGGLPTLGLEDQSLGPIGFEPQGVYLLAGPPKSGVSSLVRWLAQSMANAHPQVPRILLTARPSPLAKLPLWTAAITGPDRVQDYINNQLKPYLTTEAEPGQPRVAVFVEQFSELAGSLADATLAEALKLARRNGHLMAGAGETASFSGFNSSIPELKGARQGMLLQPETTDGDILKATLPRSRAADFPPGRGFWVSAGNVVKVQEAYSQNGQPPPETHPE